MFSRLVFIVYFIESGLMLVYVPWSPFWERNAFLRSIGWITDAAQSGYVRGAVSGVGILLVSAGLVELGAWMMRGRRSPSGSTTTSTTTTTSIT